MTPASFTPRFILGEYADFYEWLIHLHSPRFACRVRQGEDFTEAELESQQERFIYTFGDECLCEFIWLDAQPDDDELDSICEAAADFVDRMSTPK